MLLSLATQSLPGRDILGALDVAAEAGYEAVEIVVGGGLLPFDELVARRAEILQCTQRLGLEVAALTATVALGGTHNRAQLEALIALAQIAPEFGTDIVKMPSGPPPSAQATDDDWARCAADLRAAAEAAEQAGVTLAMETHLNMLSDTTAGTLRLLEAVDHPALAVTIDFCNLYNMGDDPVESTRRLAPHIAFAHVKNGVWAPEGKLEWLPVRFGDLDYAAIFRTLREVGYRGALSVEILAQAASFRFLPDEGLATVDHVAADDCAFLRGLRDALGDDA